MSRRREPTTSAASSASGGSAESVRDHVFISYAWQDGALGEWLARKLTVAGYKVWIDRFKLLGGERWPADIDRAIKTRTHRMIALLSPDSLQRPNPTKERQLALALGRERNEDFLIPLNVAGLRPTDLDWQLSDVNWIEFNRWGEGFAKLLRKLEAVGTPRGLAEGREGAAIETYLPTEVLVDACEPLASNCHIVSGIPDVVHRYTLSRALLEAERRKLLTRWAFESVGEARAFAFTDPPAGAVAECAPECVVTRVPGASWRDVSKIDGISAAHVVRSLVRKSLTAHCVARGLLLDARGMAYFPAGLLPKERIEYLGYNGRRTWVAVAGERRFGKGRFRYQLGVSFWVRADVVPNQLVVQTKVGLHVTDPATSGPLDGRAIVTRRKKVTKSWWNHEWLSRQLAVADYLAEGRAEIVIGAHPHEAVRIRTRGVGASVRPAINDMELAALSRKIDAMNAALAEETPGEQVEGATE